MFTTQKRCRSLVQLIAGSLTIPAIFLIAFAIGRLPMRSAVDQPVNLATLG